MSKTNFQPNKNQTTQTDSFMCLYLFYTRSLINSQTITVRTSNDNESIIIRISSPWSSLSTTCSASLITTIWTVASIGLVVTLLALIVMVLLVVVFLVALETVLGPLLISSLIMEVFLTLLWVIVFLIMTNASAEVLVGGITNIAP